MTSFLETHRVQLDQRYPTFAKALELLTGRGGKVIVETGCVRLKDDWGAGLSTLVFGDYCAAHDAHLWTIDNNPKHLAICQELTAEYAPFISYRESDSAQLLARWLHPPIDLLYLDSWDFPFGELLNLYGGQIDIQQAIRALRELGDEKIVELYGTLVTPCQEHCQREFLAALHVLHEKSIVLIDDNQIPGGGKPRLAKSALAEHGWQCVLEGQQTLWVKAE